jgi:acetyl esterase/lipase
VLLSPWTDLTGSGEAVRDNNGKCAMFRPENISAFAACYASPAIWHEVGVSPLFGRFDGLPPFHVQVGSEELLRDDAVRLHGHLLSAGVSSELVVYDGVFHGWQMLDGLVPEARRALEHAARFVRATGGTGAT